MPKPISLDDAFKVAESKVLAACRPAPIGLGEYAQRTFHQPLHDWQRLYLLPLLESLGKTEGRRILIHAPPQFGKSFLVSQRFIAWLLGVKPETRVRLACYNITKAAQFGSVITNLMQDEKFLTWFGPDAQIPSVASSQEFSTAARARINDGQPSFKALGLESGFTGSGADMLILDDPYASATHAISEAYEAALERFWTGTTVPRISEETNVLAMFHRYHAGDFAQRRLDEGGWEYIRFPALADENEDGSDPTGREPGEPLSPMRSRVYLEKLREDDPETFNGQFQGSPQETVGGLFHGVEWKEWEGELPPLRRWIRAWDLATSAKQTGDYTVGALVGKDADGTIIVRDVIRFRAEWPDACDEIIATAIKDGPGVPVVVESFGFQLSAVQTLARNECFERVTEDGKSDIQAFIERDAKPEKWVRSPLMASTQKGDKKEKASGWAWHAKRGRIRLVPGPWNADFIAECRKFDGHGLIHDDQVDAVSAAWAVLKDIKGGRIAEKETIHYGSSRFIELLSKHAS